MNWLVTFTARCIDAALEAVTSAVAAGFRAVERSHSRYRAGDG